MRNEKRALEGKVALVAGASRGCGRGVALALGAAGATVYVTGRTLRGGEPPVDRAPGTIEETADEVTRRGGRGIPCEVDHTVRAQVEDLFRQVRAQHGRLDVLVSAVWGGNERFLDPNWDKPFWLQPPGIWKEFVGAGPAALWYAARGGAALMAERRSGLIVAITEPILEGEEFGEQLPVTFGRVAHEGINRLVRGLAPEARIAGITMLGLMPGLMKTERVEMHLESMGEEVRRESRYDLAESTEYSGRAVVALARDSRVIRKSGKILQVADLGEEYGFTDIDGKRVANFYRAVGLM